jgi:hypothetical protein
LEATTCGWLAHATGCSVLDDFCLVYHHHHPSMLQSWQIYHTLHLRAAMPSPSLCAHPMFLRMALASRHRATKQPFLRRFQGQVEYIIKRQEQAGESKIPHDVVDGGGSLGWVEGYSSCATVSNPHVRAFVVIWPKTKQPSNDWLPLQM